MGIINRLPPSVINQIAAGEVVERPASVVKELLENAIDGGATRIDLTVERGGKDLIRIADNGRGIAADDLPLAFQPHATSKLAVADDLCRISTLGFRGEALAAIAEISKTRCQSRQASSSEGQEITIDGGRAGEISPTGCPEGTVIEVRNLFFNTPVRRSFLKSDSTESGHVQDMFSRIALSCPTVHLTFRSGGKLVHDLPPVTGIRDRVAVFFGRELADSLLWVESRIESTHLWGYVAHPSQSRSSPKSQFLYVGGRFVRDRSLAHALTEAYRGLLMVGRAPVAFLHLDLPPEEVDVNVHPTKVEVRFRDSQRIYSQLLSTVRQTFLGSDLHARLQTAEVFPTNETQASNPVATGRPEPPLTLSGGDERRQEVASWFTTSPVAEFKPFPTSSLGRGSSPVDWSRDLGPAARLGSSPRFDEFTSSHPGNADRTVHDSFQPVGRPDSLSQPLDSSSPSAALTSPRQALRAIQLHDSYLVAETDDGMMVIDQHALHERILYEDLRKRVQRGNVESQRLLVPEPVNLSAGEAEVVVEHREALRDLGIEVEPFGGDTVLVNSTPSMLNGVAPDQLLRDLAEHLLSKPIPPSRDALLADLLHMIACKAAVKAGQKLSAEEVAALIESRHLVNDSHHCPHGRPTALMFTKTELERQFGRI